MGSRTPRIERAGNGGLYLDVYLVLLMRIHGFWRRATTRKGSTTKMHSVLSVWSAVVETPVRWRGVRLGLDDRKGMART